MPTGAESVRWTTMVNTAYLTVQATYSDLAVN